VGVHDKKGMLFDKRVGVHDKQNDLFEKKLSGSAHLLQHSASNDVPSDDREASVECDPLSIVNDSGILACGIVSHCVESEESEMGGFCVASKQASSISRDLQVATCNTGPSVLKPLVVDVPIVPIKQQCEEQQCLGWLYLM
jgi:hypothetical protein